MVVTKPELIATNICEQHLRNIKNIKSKYGDLLSKDAQINAELEIDSLLSQGTFDCLLYRIVDKFQLSGIPRDKIEIEKVLSVLSAEKLFFAWFTLPMPLPYFEQTLVQLKEFVKNIKIKEPTLQ